jgi:hypothetical protein
MGDVEEVGVAGITTAGFSMLAGAFMTIPLIWFWLINKLMTVVFYGILDYNVH